MSDKRAVLLLKVALWLGALAPGAWLGYGLVNGDLGPNPVEKLTLVSGMTALVLLLLSLAISPLRRWTGWNPLIRLRRPTGLFAFAYALGHFSVWFAFDMVFNVQYMLEDIVERKFITVGMAALLILTPLAVTSTRGWIRRLGKRWSLLHRSVYLAAALAVVHYFWLVKAGTRLPLLFAGIFALLMAARLPYFKRRRPGRSARGSESDATATA